MGLTGLSRIGCCCDQDCECVPFILATQVVNRDTLLPWNLRPWQNVPELCPGSYWRLRESNALFYGEGIVDDEGNLVGLPIEFVSRYTYDGYMHIDIGCRDKVTQLITWPIWTGI